MAININDNLDAKAAKPLDCRFGIDILGANGFYTSVNQANSKILPFQRHIGLTVGIKVGSAQMKEYWYANGISDLDLIEKSGSVSGAGNGLTNTNGTIGLGGTLTTPTTITTSGTNTLTLQGLQTNTSLSSSNILLTTSTGAVQSIPYSTFTTNVTNSVSTNVINSIEAENGLTKVTGTPTKFRLGGDLLQNSTTAINLGKSAIDTDASLIFQNKFVNRPNHSEFTFSRANGVLDTFDYVQLLTGSGWTQSGWQGDFTNGYSNTVGNTLPLSNSTPAESGVQYYITVNIKPTGVNLTVTGTIGVTFGGVNVFTNIFETATIRITTSTTAGLVITPTPNFNGNIKVSITKKSTADTGSRTRLISSKGSGAMWTTNYVNTNQTTPAPDPAIDAFNNYLYSRPWLFTLYPTGFPAGTSFQIVENLQGTNKDSAVQAHYFDERVGNANWWQTFTSPTAPNFFGKVFNTDYGWVNGKVYTLRTKASGDNFGGILATTIKGTANTNGWVFQYTSGTPTTWTNGSIVDGDFPIIDRNPRTSLVVTSEGRDSGDAYNYQNGVVNILGKTVFVTGRIDQIGSAGGIRLARTTGQTTADLPGPSESAVGEMFYSTTLNRIVVRVALTGASQWIVLDSTAI
jgi:hypothetical protein